VERGLDRRQRDVDDRALQHDHELGRAQEDQRAPAAGIGRRPRAGCRGQVGGGRSVHRSATVADIGYDCSPRVDNSKPNRRQRVGDASSPDPGDSVVSGDKPFGAAIDRRMSIRRAPAATPLRR
jgi:hypothetical protein